VLISGGGTGGHVYPLLVVADALLQGGDEVSLLYVGSVGGMEASIVSRTAIPYRSVETGPIRGMAPWTLVRNLRRVYRGYQQALALLSEWPADVMLVTGGYVSVPVSLAARKRRVPLMIYLPDREPGWAVRFLSRHADRIAVSFESVRKALPAACHDRVWVSGYPVRAPLLDADRDASRAQLGLDAQRKTLLLLGGSRGARPLNRALVAILPQLLARYQVIHVTGELDWPWVQEQRAALGAELQARYLAYPYLHEELSAAMAAADLAVARAGAATMAEFPAVGLPSVLVPYPYAGQHQALNADFMAAHGAAVRLDEAELEEKLESIVVDLLEGEGKLAHMRQQARALSMPEAAARLADEVRRLGSGEGRA